MPLLRRSTSPAPERAVDNRLVATDDGLDLLDWARLRDEVDPDPLVEEATERLRSALSSLEARDEWGRGIAWRHVARIALGPLVTQLRDSQTTAVLLDATRPAADVVPLAEEPSVFAADVPEPAPAVEAALPTPAEMPFWPA